MSYKHLFHFSDEVDSLFGSRSQGNSSNDSSRKVVNTLLSETEDKPDNVFLLCSTNIPWDIDNAFYRRFNKMIYVPLPGLVDREKVFRSILENYLTAYDYTFLAQFTKQWSPSDIKNLCNEALNQRFERTKLATHFKRDTHNQNLFRPCMSTDGGKPCNVELIKNQILPPPLNLKDIERATWVVKKSGDATILPKFAKFAKEHGQEIPQVDDDEI